MKMGSNKLKIGNVSLDGNIVLAPMAGVCNAAFRTIIKEMGTGLIYGPAISSALQRAGSRFNLHGNGECKRYFL